MLPFDVSDVKIGYTLPLNTNIPSPSPILLKALLLYLNSFNIERIIINFC